MKLRLMLSIGSLVACALFTTASRADEAKGGVVYKAKCAMCHGADGSKSNPNMKALNSADVQKQTDAQLTETTSKGKGKMPGYAGKLSDDEIKAVVAFLRTLK